MSYSNLSVQRVKHLYAIIIGDECAKFVFENPKTYKIQFVICLDARLKIKKHGTR